MNNVCTFSKQNRNRNNTTPTPTQIRITQKHFKTCFEKNQNRTKQNIILLNFKFLMAHKENDVTTFISNFKICSQIYHSNIIDISIFCKTLPKKEKNTVASYFKNHNFIFKEKKFEARLFLYGYTNLVYGNGFHCVKKRHILKTAKDLACTLHDSIIIWDKTIFHDCPLYKITSDIFSINKDENVIVNNSSLAFKVNKIESFCGIQVMTLLEGMYLGLSTNHNISDKIPQNTKVEEVKELLLAEVDFKSYEESTDFNSLLMNECLMFQSLVNLFSKTDNKFLTHYFRDGSSVTIYSSRGTIYKADCINIDKIGIIPDTRKELNDSIFVLPISQFYTP
ncbi:unnamed protein product [Brachionus calyciflorus]|uniref:Uncharacterized protein n=1 Tax=Brachionus calyciflorus TaxID=104777 RepID=A0A814P7C6_9BILA|nr:unnamed protein product [Brachionus calyciflorus]